VVFARVFAGPRASRVAGQVANPDQWDGYQADQRRLLEAMRDSGAADPVVLSGDIHSSWASDLPVQHDTYAASPESVGVEFVCPSVTSDGYKEALGGDAAAAQAVTASVRATNPWVRHLDGIGHGFAVLDVTPERVQVDWWFIRSGGDKGLATDPRLDPDATVAWETSFVSEHGSRRVTGPVGQLGPRSDRPRTAVHAAAPGRVRRV
jgi:alkaline phosphatase D